MRGTCCWLAGMSNTKVEISAATFRDCFDDMMFALEEPRMGRAPVRRLSTA